MFKKSNLYPKSKHHLNGYIGTIILNKFKT